MRKTVLLLMVLTVSSFSGCSWYDVMFAAAGSAYGDGSQNAAANKFDYDAQVQAYQDYEQYGKTP